MLILFAVLSVLVGAQNTSYVYLSLDGGDLFELRVWVDHDLDVATYSLTLRAEAWIAVGFAHPENTAGSAMVNLNFPSWAVCAFEENGAMIHRAYQLLGFAQAQFLEVDLGLSDDTIVQDGITNLTFTLPFSDDPLAGPIYGDNRLIWAYGPSNDFTQVHPGRGFRVFDFQTSDEPPVPRFACITDDDCSGFSCVDEVCHCGLQNLGPDCSVPAAGYTCPADEPYCVSSVIQGDYAYIGVSMETEGWMAFCYDTDPLSGMMDGDCWIFNFNIFTGELDWSDAWTTLVGLAPNDDIQQDMEDVSGYLDGNGNFVASFRRKLDTGDEFDQLIVDDLVWGSWALGPEAAMVLHTIENRGRFEVNLGTGEIIVLEDALKTQNLIPAASIIGLVAIAGILRLIKGSNKFDWWYRRIGAPVPPSKVDRWCLDFRRELMDLTYAEAFVTLVAITTVIVFTLVSMQNQASAQRSTDFTSGHLCQLGLSMVFLPITRNSIWLPIFGISFERGVKFHRWIGRFFFLVLVIHFLVMATNPAFISTPGDLFATNTIPHGLGVAWGFMSFLVFMVMAMFTFEWFRRNQFEVFFYTHLLFPVGTFFAVLHNTDMIKWLAFPVGLYIIDRLIRFYRSHRSFGTRGAEVLGKEARITKLTLQRKGFKFEGGDYCFLQIPQVSFDEWHPFSCSNAPNDEGVVTFHILDSGEGTWTRSLADTVQAGVRPMVFVDGPHGKPTVNVFDYSTVFLVAGGVGITPIMSTVGEIAQKHASGRSGNLLTQQVHCIWSCKKRYPFHSWYTSFLNSDGIKRLIQTGVLTFHFYATREKKTADDAESNGNVSRPGNRIPTELRTKAQMGEAVEIKVNYGRPKLEELMKGHASACALACGPARMVASVQAISRDFGYHFHKETFAL